MVVAASVVLGFGFVVYQYQKLETIRAATTKPKPNSMKYFLAALLLVITFLFYWAIFNYYSAATAAPSYYDVVLHLLGGVWLAGAALLVFQSRHVKLSGGFWAILILVLGVTALVGILWEFYEYLGNVYSSALQELPEDTLGDLLAELIGAGIFAAAYLARDRNIRRYRSR